MSNIIRKELFTDQIFFPMIEIFILKIFFKFLIKYNMFANINGKAKEIIYNIEIAKRFLLNSELLRNRSEQIKIIWPNKIKNFSMWGFCIDAWTTPIILRNKIKEIPIYIEIKEKYTLCWSSSPIK